MIQNEEVPAEFTTQGIRLTWTTAGKVGLALTPLFLFAAVAYMSTIFAKTADIVPLQALPTRVERLEEFRVEQKVQQNVTNASIGAMQQDLAGLKAQINALKEETNRNTERILQRLDTFQDKH